jgi:hypothetical protein
MPDYSQPSWQTPQGNEGNVLSGIIAQAIQQRQQGQRLGMEKTQFSDQRKQAAQSMMARQAVTAGLSKIQSDPNLTPAQKSQQARDLLLQHAVSSGGSLAGLTPQTPPQITDLTGGAGVPDPKSQPSPQFTSQLQGILKSAGAPPVPPKPTGIVPGSGVMVTDSKGGVHLVPPKLIPQTKPAVEPKMTPFQNAEIDHWKQQQQEKSKQDPNKGKISELDKIKYTHFLSERSKLDSEVASHAISKKEYESQVKVLDSKIGDIEKKYPQEASKPADNAAPVPTATNPKTGEKIQFIDGKWQPIPKAQ